MIIRIGGEVLAEVPQQSTEAYLNLGLDPHALGEATLGVHGILPTEAFDWRDFVNTSVDTFVEFVREAII